MSRRIQFTLREPPALNRMLDLAKKRSGKYALVYAKKKDAYETEAVVHMRNQHRRPNPPWKLWRLTGAHFRLWAYRDPIELLAGLKWPVDALVRAGFVEDDSHRHLVSVCTPTQEIDRKDRGVTITVEAAP